MSTVNYSGDVAIIGMSGAFPGARTLEEFHAALCEGREMIRFLTPGEQNLNGKSDPNFVPAVAAMDDVDLFDASFFGMTAQEAELTDPQHRLLLEHCWRALEDAGYDSQRYVRSVGVFAGATINTYLIRNILGNPQIMQTADPLQLNIANGSDFLTTRVSYKLNLKGPSHTVQSACSTSLVAVHCGCRSLLDMECDMALAGGVSVNVNLLHGYRYQDGGIMSPDGHCRVFDANARGTVFGSGVGIVVLKRLQDALADRDPIHAVIKGSAVNNDGALKAGYTAPSVEGQAEVIAEAIANAGVPADTIRYIECHGTGTLLGDPVEVRALTKAFRSSTSGRGFCALGSVKSNIGHLDAAAGIAGLIKVVLSLKNGVLPPILHLQEPNPQIEFRDTPFYVNTKLAPWRNEKTPRRAGVSAFGVGGTNAHLVLEEVPPQPSLEKGETWQLLLLSARSETALRQAMKNLALHLHQEQELELPDVAYTLQVGRRQFTCRWAGVCSSSENAIALLQAGLPESGLKPVNEDSPRVAFFFPGDYHQRVDMGSQLYETQPVFRRHMQQCTELLRPHLKLDLCSALYREGTVEIDSTCLAQPFLCAVEYSLAQLWKSWGIKPEATLGYGLGEYVAACLAGVMTLEELLTIASAVTPGVEGLFPSLEQMRKVRLKTPQVPCLSNVTGTWIRDDEAQDPHHWIGQLRHPGRFDRGLKELIESEEWMLLETGPGGILQPMAQKQGVGAKAIASLPGAVEKKSEMPSLLRAAGQLWSAGAALDWQEFSAHQRRNRVPLPTYPFERKRYWIEPSKPAVTVPEESLSSSALPQEEKHYSPRPVLRNSYIPPQSDGERKAVSILETALGIHPIGVTDPYGELGGDSLTAVRIIDQLNLAFDASLRVVDLYEGLAVRDLVRLMEQPAPAGVVSEDSEKSRRRQYQQSRGSRRQTELA